MAGKHLTESAANGTYAAAALAASGLVGGRYVGIVNGAAPSTGGPYVVGDYASDGSATTPGVWTCTVAGSPGTWAFAGSALTSATYPVQLVERTSTQTTTVRGVRKSRHKTSAAMADGFGVSDDHSIVDVAGTEYTVGSTRSYQKGGTNNSRMERAVLLSGVATAVDGVGPSGWSTRGPRPWFDVTDPAWGTTADGVADDAPALNTLLAALPATGGADVFFPPGTSYKLMAQLAMTGKPDIRFIFGSGVVLTQSGGVGLKGFALTNCPRPRFLGRARLIGPGKVAATALAYGVSMVNCPGWVVGEAFQIEGFYHGVRTDAASTDGGLTDSWIHDCQHTAFFPHTNDLVQGNRFSNNGSNNQHHDIYLDAAIAGGVRLRGNRYESTGGAAVHGFSTTLEQYGIACEGETFLGCYEAYNFGEFNAHNLHIAAAVIKGCTNRGIVIGGNVHDAKIAAVIENSVGRNLDIAPGGVVVTQPSDLHLDITSKGGAGCFLTANNCEGTIAAVSSTGDGVRISGGSHHHLRVKTRANAGDGLRLSSGATRNVIDVASTGNTGIGVDIFNSGGGVNDNTITGQSFGNTGGQLTDNSTGNITTGLRVT